MSKSQPREFDRYAKTHGHAVGNKRSPTYISWEGMRRRCLYDTAGCYPRYGGRGIKVCEAWLSFSGFLKDMGERPKGTTLDRFPDNNGNYEPGNCRWATLEEQARNKRNNRFVTFNGETLTITDWARRLGMHYSGIVRRLKYWPIEQALTLPPRPSLKLIHREPACGEE